MLALKCLQLKFEIVLSINLSIQSFFGEGGLRGLRVGDRIPIGKFKHKIYIKLPKIGLGNHNPYPFCKHIYT